MGFVFYDTETTGLNVGFDQIVHFAAIRTDPELCEIGRFEVRSRLLPYVTPHPTALLTNGLPIERLTDPALPSHYAMVEAIRARLRHWSPALFVGFNSIRFDEEMLRQAFFQSLLPAYLTSQHRNGRTDALNLALAAVAVTPKCLEVPLGPTGRPTFRLEQLAAANGAPHGRAHDAMVDAEATLHLCRCVRARAPAVWDRFVRFSNKAAVGDFVDTEDLFVLTEFFANEAYHAPVVCLGADPDQANVRLCLDLRAPLEGLAAGYDPVVKDFLARRPAPIRRLRTNAAPAVAAVDDLPGELLEGLDLAGLRDHARRIKDDPALRRALVAAHLSGRAARPAAAHVERQIYEGFPPAEDERRMEAFHRAPWTERPAIVEDLADARLRRFGRRLIYVEHRSVLPEQARLEVERDLCDRLADDVSGGFTLSQALAETGALLAAAAPDPQGILPGYRDYLSQRLERVEVFRRGQLT
jgi:exodeoxyribonuclease I